LPLRDSQKRCFDAESAKRLLEFRIDPAVHEFGNNERGAAPAAFLQGGE
jgi:hypothetical protein